MTKTTDIGAPPLTLRAFLSLAVPSALFTVLTHGFRIVDQYFIQFVSVDAQAAVGSAVFVVIVFYAGFELLSAGAAPLAARATGAQDPEARRRVMGAATAAGLVLTAISMVVGTISAPWIARSLGLTGQAGLELERYLITLSLTVLPLVFTPLVDQVFLAIGSARAPLILHAVSLGLNMALTPLFILVFDWGIVGAGLASNLARGVATGIGFVLLARRIGLRASDLTLRGELTRILRIGYPVALSSAMYGLVYWGMLKTAISPLGPHVNAALGIGFSGLEAFTWPIFHGVSLATGSFVGRYLGAERPDLAQAAAKRAFGLATLLGVAATLAFALGGEALTDVFTNDPDVHREAILYATLLAYSQLFVAWEAWSEGVLGGAGITRILFWGSAPLNILRIPLAYALAFPLGWGAAGVWWAINITSVGKAAIKAGAAWRGRWIEARP